MDWRVIGAFALGGLLTISANIYGWYKLENKKIDFKDYRIYVALLILVIIGTFLNYAVPTYLKMFMIILLLFFVNYLLVSKNVVKCFTTVILVQGITMIAELLVALMVSLFVGNYANLFMKEPIGIILLNLAIALLLIIFIKCKFVHELSNKLVKLFESMKQNNLILCCMATIVLAITFMIMGHMQLPEIVMVFIGSILVITYVIIVIRLISVQEEFKRINNKYETSLSSLKEYEDIMDKYKIANHENKNQLLTIRGMVKSKAKNIVGYIDNLIEDKIMDNEEVFYKTSKIPEGGLRATIYSKLCKMDELGINYTLDIANSVRAVDLIKMGEDITLDICKIIGVFLDNAIEEVSELKTRKIDIELFVMDDDLCIDISNNYKGTIALDKISNKGYSTKGKGHGYGLSLVNELIKNDSNLENEREISKDLFTQRLKIKM